MSSGTQGADSDPEICEFCGFRIESDDQQCAALDDGECQSWQGGYPSIEVHGHVIRRGDTIEHEEFGTLECTRVTAGMGSVSADFAVEDSPGALAVTFTPKGLREKWGDELGPGGEEDG